MDSNEICFFFIAAIGGGAGLGRYYYILGRVWRPAPVSWIRSLLLLTPLLSLGFLYFTLQTWADPNEVQGHTDYILLFLFGGVLWQGAAAFALAVLGISPRDHALEQNNAAAALIAAGFMLAVGIAYALCNVGSGPTIGTTLYPACIASLTLLVLLGLLLKSGAGETIIVERDPAAGVRTAALLLACGIILGRAGAGDWISWTQTYRDFLADGWPVLPLACIAAWLERRSSAMHQDRPEARPTPRRGILSAGLYLLAAAGWLLHLGRW